MRTAVVMVVAALVTLGMEGMGAPPAALAKRKPKPPACPGGRFPVSGDALVPGGATDAILIDGTQVSVASGCAATVAKRKLTRTQTILTARWKSCGTLTGRSTLVLQLDATTCEALTARFRNRKGKIDRRIAGQVETPADAAGRVRDGLPPGAVLVSSAEFDQLKQRPDFHLFGGATAAADAAAQAAREAADTQLVTDFLSTHPTLGAQYTGGVDRGLPIVAPAEDGDWDVTFPDGSGTPKTFRTLGSRFTRGNVAAAIRRFPTRENQEKLYRDYFDGLAAIDPALTGNLPPPSTIGQLDLDHLRLLNDGLVSNYGQYVPLVQPPGGLPPPGYPASCAAEEGSGDGTDRSGGSLCTTHKALGVYANKTWPLKFLATCVKDQAARGTCWSFATTGSIELTVAKKHSRWINLAEQDLVYRDKALWFPTLYGDGGWPGDALGKYLETGYVPPFESQWDYNPSRSRTANDTTARYTNSCLGYGGDQSAYCSDTASQGQIVCINLLLFYFCGQVAPGYTTNGGFYPTTYSELWNPENPIGSFGSIIWAVAIFKKPVIYSFAVAPSFYPDANGYVTYNGPHCAITTGSDGKPTCVTRAGCECDIGGHAVLITGLIDNTQLPPGAPPGSGGGYVIIKNSWGCGYGDGGYAYLPYDWVKAYGWSAVVLGDVN